MQAKQVMAADRDYLAKPKELESKQAREAKVRKRSIIIILIMPLIAIDFSTHPRHRCASLQATGRRFPPFIRVGSFTCPLPHEYPWFGSSIIRYNGLCMQGRKKHTCHHSC